MPPPIQLVSLVANGGTPVQLVDQYGAPFPTTGYGALVFQNGATLLNPILDNATLINTNITFDNIALSRGLLEAPAITMGQPEKTGFWSRDQGDVSVALYDGVNSVDIASFNLLGLAVNGFVFTNDPPALDDSQKVATTAWVNDAIAASPGGTVTQINAGTGITLGPNPITTTGTISVDVAGLGGPWLPIAGGTITGTLGVNGALSTGAGFTATGGINTVNGLIYFGAADNAHPLLRRSGTTLEVVLGDQTDYADIHAKNVLSEVNVTATTGYLYTGNGTVYFGPGDTSHPVLVRSTSSLEVRLGDFSALTTLRAATQAAADNSTAVATTQWVTSKGYVTGGPYLPLAGGTITGNLNVNGNLTAVNANLFFAAANASNPRLRGNGAALDVILGDASDYASINVASITASGSVSVTSHVAAQTGYLYTGAGLVYFGTADATHPMLRRTGTAVDVILGDQSAYAPINAATAAPGTNTNQLATTAFVTAAIASGASISVGTTPPVSPNANQLWWNSNDGTGGGTLYIYYNDGNTTQWVPAAASPATGAQPGDIKASASATAPAGWLKCAGTAVSRTTYAALFAAIGTTWGAGDGSTTFNIPDFRGRSLFGVDDGAGRLGSGRPGGITGAATLGATGGEQSHITINTETALPGAAAGGVTSFPTSQPYGPTVWAIGGGGNLYNASFEYGGLAHNTVPPAAVVYWYIKT